MSTEKSKLIQLEVRIDQARVAVQTLVVFRHEDLTILLLKFIVVRGSLFLAGPRIIHFLLRMH